MAKRRKPSVYRKIRGIRDDEIRQAFQHLLQRQITLQEQVKELRNLVTAMAPRVFPEKVAEFEAQRQAEMLAKEASEDAGLSESPIVPRCAFCYGMGQFEYKREDGSVYTEPCKDCQPVEALPAISDPQAIATVARTSTPVDPFTFVAPHGMGAVEDDAIDGGV